MNFIMQLPHNAYLIVTVSHFAEPLSPSLKCDVMMYCFSFLFVILFKINACFSYEKFFFIYCYELIRNGIKFIVELMLKHRDFLVIVNYKLRV